MITLYKRNAQGKPIFWTIDKENVHGELYDIKIRYGIVGKEGHKETVSTNRDINKKIESLVKAKRKEGYKSIDDLYDSSDEHIIDVGSLYKYLDIYLPKFNTHADGRFIPMLCKTLKDDKPFLKGNYFGQWKINGERCIVTAERTNDIFKDIRFKYRSREGIDWTEKLNYLNDALLSSLSSDLIDMMIEEDVALDGEIYLPSYGINEINSFIKNDTLPQHYKLQYWIYDLAIESCSANSRNRFLNKNINIENNYECFYYKNNIFKDIKNEHLNNTKPIILLPSTHILNFDDAIKVRNIFINNGFEGLVIREYNSEYQFGGRRNNSMLKFKKIYDGKFTIVDIVPEGKRTDLCKLVCMNDINDKVFEVTINKPHSIQRQILVEKDKYIGKLAFIEYRERSGINQVPFHSRAINII